MKEKKGKDLIELREQHYFSTFKKNSYPVPRIANYRDKNDIASDNRTSGFFYVFMNLEAPKTIDFGYDTDFLTWSLFFRIQQKKKKCFF